MKRFLTLLTMVSVAAMMATSAFAQKAGPQGGAGGQGGAQGGRPGGGMRGMQNPEMMKKVQAAQDKVLKQIGASADQVKQVKALDKKEADARKAMFDKMQKDRAAGKQMDRNAMQEQMKKNREAHTAAMKKILGSKYDQYDKLWKAEMEKLRKEMGANRPGGGAGAGAGGQRRGGGGAAAGGKGGGN